jgi:HD-like signal output (HDOD) protein
LKGYVEVSSLPTIFNRINEAVNNPRKSTSDISKIIMEDAGLSARLLRIVNSAFYHFPRKIESISQAVTIVGTQQIRALALATSVMKLFKGIPKDLVDMESFWKHSVGCGLAARILATYRREPNVELYFTAGMVHDIGRLVMFGKITEEAREALFLSRSSGDLLYLCERKVIGFDHAAVGSALLQAWKLPSSLEEVVAFHNEPSLATRYPAETAIIHIADIIAHAMELGGSGERFVPPLDPVAWDRVGLPTSVLAPTLEQLDRQFNEAIHTILMDALP